MFFIRKIISCFCTDKKYRKPTKDEIRAVDFKFQKTLRDLDLYDKGKLKNLDCTAGHGGLQTYRKKRGKV